MKEHTFSITMPWKTDMWSWQADGIIHARPRIVFFWSFPGRGFKFRCGVTCG